MADSLSSKKALGECLASMDLPPGLLSSAYQSHLGCESRMWLLDNSSRMKVKDSHVRRENEEGGSIERVDNVTRWEELTKCVEFHSKMAAKCWIPTKYRLVNDPAASPAKCQKQSWQKFDKKFNLCHGSRKDVPSEMNQIRHVMKNACLDQKQCPLTACLQSLYKGLSRQGSNISARNAHVTLVICTQGKPTDKDGKSGSNVLMKFQNELALFSKLPVRIIIRLCTDDEKVRDMFNTMDSRFDSVDVLDDFWGEALEVYLHNPWLTYAMGLHRLRESGLAPGVMDDLDTRPLCLDEIHRLCKTLFIGNGGFDLPHPHENWDDFLGGLKLLDENENQQWNPIKKKRTPWINLRKLQAMHGGGESSDYHRNSMYNSNSRKHTTHAPRKDRRSRKETHKNDVPQNPPKTQRPSPRVPLDSKPKHHRNSKPQTEHETHHQPSNYDRAETATTPGKDDTLALLEVIKRWSHRPPKYKEKHSLEHILVTAPRTFPPTNAYVEPHEYFFKWKSFDMEAFNDSGDQRNELLRRAVRKAKFFLHPDKLPKDLTENQTLLFKNIWDVIQDREANTG